MIVFSLVLFYLDSNSRGINLLDYIFDPKRINFYKKNRDVPIDEDNDVQRERRLAAELDAVVIF